MSKAALALVGITSGLLLFMAIKDADAEPEEIETPPEDDIIVEVPDAPPLPSTSPGLPTDDIGPGEIPDSPAASDPGGSGSGEPVRIPTDLLDVVFGNNTPALPDFLKNLDLTAMTGAHYMGEVFVSDGNVPFDRWSLDTSLQTVVDNPELNLTAYISVDNPQEWITIFHWRDGRQPPFLHKVSNTANKNWMITNILGLPFNSASQS